jgi:hypothetical protein
MPASTCVQTCVYVYACMFELCACVCAGAGGGVGGTDHTHGDSPMPFLVPKGRDSQYLGEPIGRYDPSLHGAGDNRTCIRVGE